MRAILVSVLMVFGLVATANAQFSGGASGPRIPPTNIELQQRCDDGQSAACDTLGLRFYKGGKGSEGDLKKSAAFFQRACDGRDAFGCSNLARNYLYGRGVKQDFARAVRLAETGCKGDVDTGCFIVGLAYHDGIAGYPKDRNRAISYYRQACGDGKKFDHACEVLAEMGASRTVPKVVAQAPPAPDPKAAALAANEAGVAAYNRREFALSASQFTTACNGGLAMGCYNLGMRLWNGEGVSQNKTLALQQFNKGCAGGVALACAQVAAADSVRRTSVATPTTAKQITEKQSPAKRSPSNNKKSISELTKTCEDWQKRKKDNWDYGYYCGPMDRAIYQANIQSIPNNMNATTIGQRKSCLTENGYYGTSTSRKTGQVGTNINGDMVDQYENYRPYIKRYGNQCKFELTVVCHYQASMKRRLKPGEIIHESECKGIEVQ